MVLSITYRRPAYVPSRRTSIGSKPSMQDSFRSSSTLCPAGIPEALSFDRIISGGTCPPCTVRDFMNFLQYIEFSAENLQFYLWFRDYVKRFDALPEAQKDLAAPINSELEQELSSPKLSRTPAVVTREVREIFAGTDFGNASPSFEKPTNPFETPEEDDMSAAGWASNTSTLRGTGRTDHGAAAAKAFEVADVKLQPFTIQPFREEVTRIISTYVADGAPRQLNLSAKERADLLKCLAITTHPSAFQTVLRTIEWTLRHQAHPNFIRWTVANGNRARWYFARGLGISLIAIGLVIVALLAASGIPRTWRLLAAIPLIIGISTLFAAWKGMCVVLHGMHHRHLRPWELFVDDDEAASIYELKKGAFDPFGSANSHEDEPWVVKYERRNVIRKVFDREVWIQEPALRQIQDTIFLQSLLVATCISLVTAGLLCIIPPGHHF